MPSFDEETDSSDDNTKYRALPVADLPSDFDPSKPPTSAEEYLHHVMWEARQCQDVVTVKLDKSRIKKQRAVVRPSVKAVAPPGFSPDAETQKEIVDHFLRTKKHVDQLKKLTNKPEPPVKLPSSENPEHWCKFCFGNTFQRSILEKLQRARASAGTAGGASAALAIGGAVADVASTSSVVSAVDSSLPGMPAPDEGQQPLLSIVLNIKQSTLQNLVEWHVGWLEVAGFSAHQGRWLYSLLCCLEKPLIPELCDNVRKMVLLCATVRSKLDSPAHPFICQLNTIITIITRFFNQDDLADKVE